MWFFLSHQHTLVIYNIIATKLNKNVQINTPSGSGFNTRHTIRVLRLNSINLIIFIL